VVSSKLLLKQPGATDIARRLSELRAVRCTEPQSPYVSRDATPACREVATSTADLSTKDGQTYGRTGPACGQRVKIFWVLCFTARKK